MKARSRLTQALLGIAVASLAVLGFADVTTAADSAVATTTVTAISKKEAPPAVSKSDVQLSQGKERKQVAKWTKAEKLYLAILIDDSIESETANQWGDLKQFILAQPSTTSIAVGYATNGNVSVSQDFTTDHELAAKVLRIPLGNFAAYSSPYLSVIDWMKRWPATGDRRSLLLISSGIDYFRSGFGPIYPDVDTAISIAEKGNINLWSIYAPGVGHRSRSFFLANNAQNNLSKLSEETGGEAFFLGTLAPVSFKPFLDELQMHLNNQYLLSFAGDGGTKGKFTGIRLKTELSNVELMHANQVWIPATK